ncbi:hypothetical protein Hdeb2414_s0018g00527711 [Helianthus debilis subsp. tardiflorus]
MFGWRMIIAGTKEIAILSRCYSKRCCLIKYEGFLIIRILVDQPKVLFCFPHA